MSQPKHQKKTVWASRLLRKKSLAQKARIPEVSGATQVVRFVDRRRGLAAKQEEQEDDPSDLDAAVPAGPVTVAGPRGTGAGTRTSAC